MKKILQLFLTLGTFGVVNAQQNINADCISAIALCNVPTFTFNATSGVGTFTDIPAGNNISNPTTNPASSNSGCLLSNEYRPQWLMITVGNAGTLEFIFGASNSSNPQAGFYDWAMWPYTPTTCNDIFNNTLPPIRCNWNGSSSGGTGIASAGNQPPGSSPLNFEPPLQVQPCQQFIICISNYSGVNTLVGFQNIGTASLSCDPNCLSVNNPSVCAGGNATIIAANSGTLTNLTYSMQPGGFVSNTPTFVVNPMASGNYTVFATGLNIANVPVTQTAVSSVTVYNQPTTSVTFTNTSCTNTVNAFNLNLNFTPSVAPGYTITWQPVPAGINSPTQTSSSGGIFPGPYSATVMSTGGCSTVANFTMDPTPAAASISLTPFGPVYSITCTQPTITVGALNPSYSYTWSNGLIAPKTGSVASFDFTGTGVWTITALNPVSNCIATKTVVVGMNTVTPVSSLSPSFQSITCNSAVPLTVTLTATSPTVNFTHYVMSPVGGSVAAGTASLLYQPGPGTYTHCLVNNVNGCSTCKEFTVAAGAGFPTFSLTSQRNFTLGCNSRSFAVVTLDNGNTSPIPGGAVSYTIIPPNSSSATPSGSLSNVNAYTITAPGTWTAITKDNSSFCETRIPFSIIQNTLAPSIDSLDIPRNILDCNVPKTTLRALSLTPNVSYNWSFPGNPGNLAGDSIVVNADLGSTTKTLVANYTLTISDNSSTCSSFTVIPILQNLFRPKALISNGGIGSLSCNTGSIVLSNASSSGIQGSFFPKNQPVIGYIWEGPTPQLKNTVSSTYLAQTVGDYTLVAKDLNNGCTSQTVLTINDDRNYPVVNNPVVPPPAILDCGLLSTKLTPLLTSETANLSYSWQAVPGASVSGATTRTLTTNKIGIYRVLVTNTVNGCATSANMEVINGELTASFDASALEGFAPLTVEFTNKSASSTGNASVVSVWSFGNGATRLTSSATAVSAVYNQPGTYTVQLYSSKGSCTDTAYRIINVDMPSRMIVPNVFTPNGDGANDLFILQKADNLTSINAQIFDRWGRKVYELSTEKGQIEWDGRNQSGKESPEGTYFYIITATGKDGQTYDVKGTLSLIR